LEQKMTQEQLISVLGSGTLVLTLVALVRKIFPSINGRNVYLLAIFASILATFGSIYVSDLPKWAYSVVVSIVVAVLSVGAATFTQSLVDRSAEKSQPSNGGTPQA
jgi:predicted RND superfamily exporter protein